MTSFAVPKVSCYDFLVFHLARSLRHPNYRLFFIGQSLSLMGSWMTLVAINWLAYRLTSSAATLGLINFTGQIPVLLFTAFAGVWLERLDLRRALMATQFAAMLQSFALATLVFTHTATIPLLTLLVFLQGLINAFDMPARHAFMIEMIEDKTDLSNAIALNSFMVNTARLVGPAIAGILIALIGEGFCFLIDGISYIAIIISLTLMTTRNFKKDKPKKSIWHEFTECTRYAYQFSPIRLVLLYLAFFSIIAVPFNVLLPVYAATIFKQGADTYGFMMGSVGLGALMGALLMSMRKKPLGLLRIMTRAGLIFSVSLMIFAYSKFWWFSLLCLICVGIGYITLIVSVNTFLQTVVEDHMRSRIMGLFSLSFIGMVPIGSALIGVMASRFGAPHTLFVNSLLCFGAVWIFHLQLPAIRKLVRPLYMKKGILPPQLLSE